MWDRFGALLSVPRLGLPARRVVGAIGGRRRSGGIRPRRFRLVPGLGHDVRPVDPGQPRPARGAVRSGPAGAALDPYRLDDLELGERTAYECAFNWKVLLENYCENYHTPFVHSQLPVGGYEYPIETAGPVVFAWDRPLAPRDDSERALHHSRPGDAGWAAVADVAAAESFNNGGYFALFPNTAISCFAGFAATFRLTPSGPSATRVEREYFWHPSVPPHRRAADLAATREVVEQDLTMCEAVQGTYDAGLSADGVLSTEHENGVAHVHQLLFAALR